VLPKSFKKHLLKIITALFVFLPALLPAQVLNFRHFGAKEGLIQSQVFTILQDDNGYLWFGTVNGAARYDGREFQNFTMKNGLSANYIYSGLKDRDGNLWFGHSNGMATKFNWKTREFCPVYIAPTPDNETIVISKIVEDKDGRIWFLAPGKGAYYIDNDSLKTVRRLDGLPSDQLYDLTQSASGKLWFALDKFISIYDPKSQTFESPSLKLKNCRISSLLKDLEDNIWIGTKSEGLFKYNEKTKKLIHFTINDGLVDNSIVSLYLDRQGRVWASTRFNGVSFQYSAMNGNTKFAKISTKNGLVFDNINVIFEDSEGNYWFGTNGQGLSQLRDRRFAVWASSEDFPDKTVWSIVVDYQNSIWVGTNKGIAKIEHPSNQAKHYTRFENIDFGNITRIAEDRNGDIWFIAYEQGLYKISNKTGRIKQKSFPGVNDDSYQALIADDNQNIWIGTKQNGLIKHNYRTQSYENFTRQNSILGTDSVYVIYEDSKKNIWICLTNGGIVKYDGHKLIPVESPIKSVLSMSEGPLNDYWFLDMQDQLYHFKDDRFTNYSDTKGLDGQAMYSVIADSHSVWVGTSTGVARLKYGDSVFNHFSSKEGFPIAETNENAVFKGKNGRLWFGTIDGAVCYYPSEERENKTPPSTSIRDIKLFYKNKPQEGQVQFAYKQNHLTFDFIGISLTVPERVRYRYHLDGFDEGWSPDTDFPSVTYSNLPPGEYNFQVKACNNDGVWNDKPVEYAFEILPPFWQTWWFAVLMILVFSVIIYLFIRWRMHTVTRMNFVLGMRVDERTKELKKEKESAEQALAALKESETKFRTYTELTSSGIFIFQGNNFQYFNQACVDISGYPEEELIQKSIWDLVHPDYHEEIKKRLIDRMTGKEVLNRYEFKARKKDGEVCWLDFSGLLIEYNNAPALLATLVDITDRKHAEEDLMAEKERLAVTLRSISDGVITAAINGQVTLINERAREILGVNGQVEYKDSLNNIFVAFDEHSGNRVKDPLEEIKEHQGRDIPVKDCVLKDQNGDQKFVSLAVSPLRDKYSQLIGGVLVIRDMSERRQMEQELFKSQKLESVGVLAGGIAHDFNNILTAVIGNLSLAKINLNPSDKIYDRIEKAEKASARAQDLTQQLLTFSKGGAPIKRVTSIQDIVTESVGFVLSGSNVKCQLDFKNDIPSLEVDAGQISQVIQNLAINADQAMPDGGNLNISFKTIKVLKPRKGLIPGKYVQLDIADQGIGIPKDYLDKIFDPFFTTKQSGSGLGLATSYSIIKKHGGLLSVKSELEKGTVFTIFLPVSSDLTTEEIKIQHITAEFKGEGRILVMDDETFIHETATSMLNSFGFEVDIAIDGDEALERYQKSIDAGQPYKCVLMDLTIPGGMGGKAAIGKMIEMDPQATVIVSSGYSSDPVMSDYIEYGFKGCLKKPYRVTELVGVLKEVGMRE